MVSSVVSETLTFANIVPWEFRYYREYGDIWKRLASLLASNTARAGRDATFLQGLPVSRLPPLVLELSQDENVPQSDYYASSDFSSIHHVTSTSCYWVL